MNTFIEFCKARFVSSVSGITFCHLWWTDIGVANNLSLWCIKIMKIQDLYIFISPIIAFVFFKVKKKEIIQIIQFMF